MTAMTFGPENLHCQDICDSAPCRTEWQNVGKSEWEKGMSSPRAKKPPEIKKIDMENSHGRDFPLD